MVRSIQSNACDFVSAWLAKSGSLRIRIRLYAPDSVEQLASLGQQPKALDVVFDGSGFAEALKASQSP